MLAYVALHSTTVYNYNNNNNNNNAPCVSTTAKACIYVCTRLM